MRKFTFSFKTLLAVALLCVGQNAWGDVVESYPFATWVKAAGSDQQSFTFSSAASAIVNNVNCYTYTSALNGNSLGDRFAVSNTHKGSGLLDQVWFRLKDNSETNSYTGLFVGSGKSTYFAILNLVQGDKVTITFNNNPDGNKFYSSNATYDNSGTPTAIVSGTTKPESGKEYTITSDGHLGLYMTSYSTIKTVSITRNITSYTTRMATAKSSGSSLSSSVMRTSVKSSLTSALSSEYVDMASSSITSSNIDAYITALEALETAVSNAQASADNFAILNELIANANSFATTVTEYNAPSGAESVYTEDADVDPVALASSVRAAVITAGTANENTDITALIANSSFELGNTLGWTTVASDDTGARWVGESGDTYYTSDADGNYLFNTWAKGTPITQTLGTLPAGQYTLTAKVASNGATVYLMANDGHEGTLTNDGAAFIDASYTFVLGSAAEVTIGAVGGDGDGNYTAEGHWWYKADKFTLTYVGQDPVAQAKASLEAEIETANTLKDSWTPKVGTAPFKYDATYYNALGTQITSATSVLNSGSETVSDYTTAESALETAESNMASSTQNTPDPDKYYQIFVANNDGTASDYNLYMLYERTKTQVKVSATPYPIKIVVDTDNSSYYNIQTPYGNSLCTDKSAKTTAYVTSAEGIEKRCNQIKFTLNDNGTIVLGGNAGSGNFNNYQAGASEGSLVTAPQGGSGKWVISDAVEVTETPLFVSAAAKTGTFISAYDNLTPATVKAYTVAYKAGNALHLEENESGVLSANTPYILTTEEVSNVNSTFKGIKVGSDATSEVNGLVGLLTAGTVPAGSYVLQNQSGVTSFYQTSADLAGTANRCYLDLTSVPEESTPVKGLSIIIVDGTATGVEAPVAAETVEDGIYYNLNGQQVTKDYKGIVIVNGKKFYNK